MSNQCVVFESLFINTDVTYVKCHENFVFAGVGSWLIVYNADTSETILKKSVFHGQRIHGISPSVNGQVAVFGGRELVILNILISPGKTVNELRWSMDEWIIELCWMECGSKYAVLTADNVTSLWDANGPCQLLEITCDINCLIYSALILENLWFKLVVFSGTAFGDVVLWKPSLDTKGEQRLVLHTLSGHDGVVSSVSYDETNNIICTTSDDRSVRVWKVVMTAEQSWETASVHLLHSLYGHTGRVWKAIAFCGLIISAGEDSLVMVWGSDGKLMKQWKYHQGSSVWTMDCSIERKIIVVGGSDGGIITWPFNMWKENSLIHECLPLHGNSGNEISSKGKTNETNSNGIIPRRIIILKHNHVVALTKCASIWHYDDYRRAEFKYKFDQKKFSNMCLFDVSPSRNLLALASCDGEIIVMSDVNCQKGETLSKLCHVHSSQKSISSLHWAADDHILICCSTEVMELWKIHMTNDKTHCMTKVQEFDHPAKKRTPITVALIYDGYLLCGDRVGNIHIHPLMSTSYANGGTFLNAEDFITKIKHGKEGVTSLICMKSELISVGRDGMFCRSEIVNGILHDISSSKLPLEWVSKLIVSNSGILVAGFNSIKFVLWSQEEKRILLEIECGGGHRPWDCVINDDIFTFIFLKDNVTHRHTCNVTDLMRPPLLKGLHLNDINCQKVICERANKPSYRLTACGCENNSIYIMFLQPGLDPKVAAVLDTHISSIRTLDVSNIRKSEDYDLFILITAGGRAQLKLWKIFVLHSKGETELPKVCCSEIEPNMLTNYSNKKKVSWRAMQLIPEGDMRYMDISAMYTETFGSENCGCTVPLLIIAAACSDGSWRLLCYDTTCRQLTCLNEFTNDMCLLKICYSYMDSYHCVFTMDTIGYLRLWDITHYIDNMKHIKTSKCELHDVHNNLNLKQNYKSETSTALKVHQMGINSCDTIKTYCGQLLIATGGDDNTLVLTLVGLHVENSGNLTMGCTAKWKDTNAHLAQITGLKFLNSHLITTSVDQRISIWKWSYLSKVLMAVKLQSFCSTVADIKGLIAWKSENGFTISVYGQGMELIKATQNEEGKKTSFNSIQSKYNKNIKVERLMGNLYTQQI